MNLLQLSHRLPWPPIDGGKKGTLGFVQGYRRHPATGHQSLLCMVPEEEEQWARDWAPHGVDLMVDVRDFRNSVPRVLANTLFSAVPFNMAKYQQRSFAALIDAAVGRQLPDVVHFDSLHTTWYGTQIRKLAPGALRVLRCHNAEHVILERLAESESHPAKRALIALQARRLKGYEAAALDQFDLILAITEADASRFRELNPRCDERMIVLPAGADVPDRLAAAPPLSDGVLRLVHVAAMDWLPNQTGLRWFLTNVVPLLDRAGLKFHLDVVGKNMPREFLEWRAESVTVHGFVENLSPILEAAHLAVVPLWVGGGMRVKILDYWAAGIPVVSTRVGAEGLYDAGAAAVELADSPEDFAAAICRLGGSAEAREALRAAAFKKVSDHYGWKSLIDGLMTRYARMRPSKP